MALPEQTRTWTYDDLAALPDDGHRYEIVEGELFAMPAPSWEHVAVVMNLIGILLPVVQSLGGRLATAPVDLFLPGADPVQPDILAILPGSLAVAGGLGVHGPPDLIVEVLSPTNRTHDLFTKRALYGRARVGEYWIVDPAARTVDMLSLHRDALLTLQTAAAPDFLVSPILAGNTFPLAAIFAGVGEDRD